MKSSRQRGPRLGIVEERGIAAADFPGVEEGRPVDELADFAQRQIVDDLQAGESGLGNIDRFPVGAKGALAAFLEGEERLARALALVGDAGALVFEIVVGDEFVASASSLSSALTTPTAREASSTCTTALE